MSVHLERRLRKWCASSRACARRVPESDSALRIAHGECVGRSTLLAGSLSGSCQKMSILLVLSEKQTRAGVVGSYWVAAHPKHGPCDRCRDHHGPTSRPCYAGVAAGQGHHAHRTQRCARAVTAVAWLPPAACAASQPTRGRLSQGRGESSDRFDGPTAKKIRLKPKAEHSGWSAAASGGRARRGGCDRRQPIGAVPRRAGEATADAGVRTRV